jgi:hypothetical protein
MAPPLPPEPLVLIAPPPEPPDAPPWAMAATLNDRAAAATVLNNAYRMISSVGSGL